MVEEMKGDCKGLPALPAAVPPARSSFEALAPADPAIWRQVGFPEMFNYLRRNKHLNIPTEWKDLIPAKM